MLLTALIPLLLPLMAVALPSYETNEANICGSYVGKYLAYSIQKYHQS